jgi:hypothetical protein
MSKQVLFCTAEGYRRPGRPVCHGTNISKREDLDLNGRSYDWWRKCQDWPSLGKVGNPLLQLLLRT